MLYAQIMAGGIGSRMGNTDKPKQFLSLAGKPILIHTIEKFILVNQFDIIFVSVHPKWMQYAEDLINTYIEDKRIVLVPGGAERNDTVMNVIFEIERRMGRINRDDVLVMHDAVRPFVTLRMIEQNIEKSYEYDAVDTIIAATDTIVVAENGIVAEIPVRSKMYQGQTPQTVNVSQFKEQYELLSQAERDTLSDSVKVMLIAGKKVATVLGDEANIKITKPFDLKVAEFIANEGE